jgi:hypothetical protein
MSAGVKRFSRVVWHALGEEGHFALEWKCADPAKARSQSVTGSELGPTHASLRSTISIMIASSNSPRRRAGCPIDYSVFACRLSHQMAGGSWGGLRFPATDHRQFRPSRWMGVSHPNRRLLQLLELVAGWTLRAYCGILSRSTSSGESLPRIPKIRIHSEEEEASLPGARRIDAEGVVPGPSPEGLCLLSRHHPTESLPHPYPVRPLEPLYSEPGDFNRTSVPLTTVPVPVLIHVVIRPSGATTKS